MIKLHLLYWQNLIMYWSQLYILVNRYCFLKQQNIWTYVSWGRIAIVRWSCGHLHNIRQNVLFVMFRLWVSARFERIKVALLTNVTARQICLRMFSEYYIQTGELVFIVLTASGYSIEHVIRLIMQW